mmetsp:Transcript_33663/g.88544  ORF Transcript_33663/g.88544 Transcript_33663/m.88544 type:complete len:90 (-) Transcript_33663:95-364(-)
MLQAHGEVAWHTWDCKFMASHDDSVPLRSLEQQLFDAGQALIRKAPDSMHWKRQGLIDPSGRLIFHGGMEDLSRFHTTLVQGGGLTRLG